MTMVLWHESQKRQPLLGNGNQNMFLQQRINKLQQRNCWRISIQQQRNHENDVFYVVCAEAI
jgi:hypothetical protein